MIKRQYRVRAGWWGRLILQIRTCREAEWLDWTEWFDAGVEDLSDGWNLK